MQLAWHYLPGCTLFHILPTLVVLLTTALASEEPANLESFIGDVVNHKWSVMHKKPARIAITSQCGGDYYNCNQGDFTKAYKNHQEYAQKHGYEYFLLETRLSMRSPVWDRFPMVSALHNRGAEWVLYLDADALFMNTSINVEDFIEKHGSGKDLIVSGDMNVHYQAGVYLMRKSEWSHTAMCKAWAVCPSPGFEELGAMMTVLGGADPKDRSTWSRSYIKLSGSGITESEQQAVYKYLPRETREHLALLPQRAMDSYPEGSLDATYKPGDWIIHFAGVPGKNNLVRKFAGRKQKFLHPGRVAEITCQIAIQIPKEVFDCSGIVDMYYEDP